ncbi:MAG: hypothetical protein EOM90_07375 [Alphaproteobacteria bacterium]|nr:hypothetical protein [Alphaproteobacteria bacterium]
MEDLSKINLAVDATMRVRIVNELNHNGIITAQELVDAWEKNKCSEIIIKKRLQVIEENNRKYPVDKTKDQRIFAKRKTLRLNIAIYKYLKELQDAYEHYSGKTIPDIEKPWLHDNLYRNYQINHIRETEKSKRDSDRYFKYKMELRGIAIKATFNHKISQLRLSKYQQFTDKAVLYCEACNTISCIEIEIAEELAELLLGQKVQISFRKNYFHSKFCKFCDSRQMEVVIKKIEAKYDPVHVKRLKKRYRESIKKKRLLENISRYT